MEFIHVLYSKCLGGLHLQVTGKHLEDDEDQPTRIDKRTWHNLEESFGLCAPEAPDNSALSICEQPKFEMFIGAMVLVNAVAMALELDHSHKHATLDERIGWALVDIFFCALFSCEMIFRIWCLGLFTFFKQPRYLADVFLVAFNLADSAVQLSGSDASGMSSLAALRILRLFKIMKLLRLVSHVKELSLIAIGLVSALKSLQWVSLLLGVVTFVLAVMFRILMGRECDASDVKESFLYHFPDYDPVVKCEEFWGTVLRCMYTLYQVTTLESWSEIITRPIWDSRPAYVALILGFQLVTTFGLLNIVVAAIVDGTMNSIDELVLEHQNSKRVVAHLQALSAIFLQGAKPNADGQDVVTRDSLVPILLKPDVRRKLLLLNIEYDDPSQIWRILDSDQNGSCDIKDFTTTLMRMRGDAKAKDLLAVRSLIYRVEQNVVKRISEVKTLCESALSVSRSCSMPLDVASVPAQTPVPMLMPPLAVTSESIPLLSSGVDAASTVLQSDKLKNSQDTTCPAPQADQMDQFQENLKGEFGKLSLQMQEQLFCLREQLSKDFNGRLARLERNLLSMPSPLMQPPLTGTAAELASLPSVIPREQSRIPREQSLPSLPSKPCCNVAFGGLDREAVAAPTGNAVVVTVPVVPPTNFGSFSREGTKEDSLNTKLQLVFKGEHESMLARLDEQYKMLLRRLHIGLTGDEQEELLARLAEEPPLTKAEPKALEASPARSRSPNLQNASTQTSNEEESHAAGILAQSSPKANATDSSDADQILESLQREKKERVGGFAQAFEDTKRGSAPKASWLENFVHGNTFEALFAMLITANALIMAMEVQFTGMEVGFQIGFEGSNRKASDVWPGAREVFTGLEFAFGLMFVLEVLLKIAVDRIRFIRSIWNWIDFVIVGTWCIDTVIGISSVLNPMMLRLFRLTKLLRVAKLFKSFQAFDSLSILIGSMKAGRAVFFWSVVVLFTAQMASALLMTQLLESYLTEPGGSDFVKMQRHEVYKYFGTFTRAFITTIQLTLGNWVPVCRILLENVGEEWSIFIIIYILFITFAAMRVISAVFIVETQKVASTDEELLILQKERQIDRLNRNFAGVFKELDATGDGMVDWEEFQAVLLDQRVLIWLAALDLDLDQCEGMFSLLDGGDGRISFQNFVKGVQRLKGGAKSVDLIMLMNRQQELAASVAKLIKMVETHITGLGGSIE